MSRAAARRGPARIGRQRVVVRVAGQAGHEDPAPGVVVHTPLTVAVAQCNREWVEVGVVDGQLSNTPHPTPPRTEADRVARLRLIRSHRVGPATWHRLVGEHGSARAALAALPAVARAAGVADYASSPESAAQDELRRGREAGAYLLFHGAADYPEALAALPDAPPLLWALGDAALLRRPMIAIVGARNASSLGVRTARQLAAGLGEAGFVVVSGLARGIDREAHAAALATGTVAVHAGGVDVVYPEENAPLAAEIGARGLRLSEQPIGLRPQARHFPQRNHIIAGLVRAVIVIEGAARSGSLITARAAADIGREVLAVPGHPFDARAAGANELIRDGATLIRGVEDVLEAIGSPEPCTRPAPRAVAVRGVGNTAAPAYAEGQQAPAGPAGLRARILERLSVSPLGEDQLIRDLSVRPAELAPETLHLELEGLVQRLPGGLLARV